MRRAVLLLGVLGLMACSSTPQHVLPPEERIVRRIYEVSGTQDELYRVAMEWMAKTFRSAQDVIQYQDKAEGVIVGKGVMVMNWTFDWPTHFTLTLEVKEGKARATFSDIYIAIRVKDRGENMLLESQEQLDLFGEQGGFAMLDSLEAALKKGVEKW